MKYLIKTAPLSTQGKLNKKDILIDGNAISRIDRDIGRERSRTGCGRQIHPSRHHWRPGTFPRTGTHPRPASAVKAVLQSPAVLPPLWNNLNTKPAALTQELLEEKYQIAAQTSRANYTFFMGTSNDNFWSHENGFRKVGALKIFMGSSGNMLVGWWSVCWIRYLQILMA